MEGSRIGLYRNRHALELGQRVECARAPISDLLPGDELGRGRGTDGVEDTNVRIKTYGHDAGDRCAHPASPGQEPGTYPLRRGEVEAWLEVRRPHGWHGTAARIPMLQDLANGRAADR